jgi:cell division protease FtsH
MEIARMTVFDAGAELNSVVNEAGLIAIREGRTAIAQRDLISAIQRVHFGLSRSQHIGVKELYQTAYHEAGHTLVSYFRNQRSRIQVVTVVPTASTLGYMWSVEKDDAFTSSMNKQDYLVNIEMSLGGYCAENLYMETTTSGVSADLHNVGRIATNMVRYWGMGSFKFNTKAAYGFANDQKASNETEREIELEVKKLVDDCMKNVNDLLLAKRADLDKVAHALVEKETLYYKDLVHILEPRRSDSDIEREIQEMSERKLVGKPPVINIGALPGLLGSGGKDSKKSDFESKDGENR